MNDCEAALQRLAESLRFEPSIGAHFKSAECLEEKDPYAAFWHLREAAAIAHEKRDERGVIAERRADELALRAGGIRFQIGAGEPSPPGLEVSVDGRTIDRFHLAGPIAVPPGNHAVSVTTTDGGRLERTVRVERGIVTASDVPLPRAASPAAPAPAQATAAETRAEAPSPRGLSGRQTLALALAGAGAASLAIGTAYGVVTLEKRSELDRACNGTADACTGTPSVVDPVLDSAERNATASTVLLVTGAGLVAAAALVWLTAPSRSASASARPLVAGWRW